MITSHTNLLSRWRRQIVRRRNLSTYQHPRHRGALSYVTCGPIVDGFIEVQNLVIVVLHDHPSDPRGQSIRLAGYVASRVPWGVQWGSRENSRFCKDLSLKPRDGGHGPFIDPANKTMLRLALNLDRLAYYVDQPKARVLRLPNLWAGFRAKDALFLNGSGPELDVVAERARVSPQKMMNRLCRSYSGLVLYPLDWVSQHWEKAVAVFADMRRFPTKQVFQLSDPSTDLCGYRGASHFDFFNSRFDMPFSSRQPVSTSIRVA